MPKNPEKLDPKSLGGQEPVSTDSKPPRCSVCGAVVKGIPAVKQLKAVTCLDHVSEDPLTALSESLEELRRSIEALKGLSELESRVSDLEKTSKARQDDGK